MAKVSVPDRNAIITNHDETKVIKPEGLQKLIDNEICKFDLGRSFVRPSGTEDVVRVYAEAKTKTDAEKLSLIIQNIVKNNLK